MKYINIILIVLLLGFVSSCAKIAKNTSKEVAKESAEKVVKETAENVSESALRGFSRDALRKMKWKDILKSIKKEHINFGSDLERLDGTLQRGIEKTIHEDPSFLEKMLACKPSTDEFKVLTKDAPKLAENINFYKMFVNAKSSGRKTFDGLTLKNEGSLVKIFDSKGNKIAQVKDGIVTLNPLKKGEKIFSDNSILNRELLPNSIYKIKGENGVQYLYKIDGVGRISNIEAKGLTSEELMTNVINRNHDAIFDEDGEQIFKNLKQTYKGNDLNVSYRLDYTDGLEQPKYAHLDIKSQNKTLVSKTLKVQEIDFSDFISKNLSREERIKIMRDAKFPTDGKGKWSGARGNSDFYPNLDDVPKSKGYGNKEGLTWRQIKEKWGLKENDPIPYKNGQPDFEAMNQVYGKVVWNSEKGIGEHLKASNNFNKLTLDINANKKLAEQKGLNPNDRFDRYVISVYRGSSEYVEKLAEHWKCSAEEVWKRCDNPTRRILVWHENLDGKTMILVPWDIHAPLNHVGGMKMYKEAYKKSIG